MATVEIFDSGTGMWETLDYESFSVTFAVSDVDAAPKGQTKTTRRAREVTAADRLRVVDASGDVVLAGDVESAPTQGDSTQRVTFRHDLWPLLEDTVDVTLTTPTDEEVIQAAIDASAYSGSVTLSYAGTATTLGDDYDVSGRTVQRVFRDMVDRTGRVWWIGSDTTIHVETRGGRGQFAAVDTSTDPAVVREFDAGSRDSVVNYAEVVGTGNVAVTGTAQDSTSINTYGRQPTRINVSYITSQSEANDYASALLIPDPLASAEVVATGGIGDVTQPRVNQTLQLTDDATGLDDTLTIEQHVFEEGRSTFKIGEGAGVNTAKFNREQKSQADTTDPGSVYGGDRLADDSVDTRQLVNAAVIESKLEDLSVSLQKVQDGAISETKVQNDSISTPKLKAEAVTAAKILADTITANEISAGTITALEIAADTLTANEIATLSLSTNQLEVGSDADFFAEFIVDTVGGDDIPVFQPSSDSSGRLGSAANRWAAALLQDLQTNTATLATGGSTTIQVSPGSDPEIRPGSDAFGRVGTSANEWFEMWSRSYNTNTPEPLDGVAPTDIIGHSWHEPPAYATQMPSHETESGYTRGNPNKTGIELGHMLNYVFETAKAQAEQLEQYEQRIAELEDRLTELEGQV